VSRVASFLSLPNILSVYLASTGLNVLVFLLLYCNKIRSDSYKEIFFCVWVYGNLIIYAQIFHRYIIAKKQQSFIVEVENFLFFRKKDNFLMKVKKILLKLVKEIFKKKRWLLFLKFTFIEKTIILWIIFHFFGETFLQEVARRLKKYVQTAFFK
jgi:hypothetical protein